MTPNNSTTPIVKSVDDVVQDTSQIINQLSVYGEIILDSLYLIAIAMLAIVLLHQLSKRLIFPYIKNKRLIKVLFATIYALIIDIMTLLILKEIGFDVKVVGQISIITILIGAFILFFLIPFLPRLPFIIGQMIETNGVIGVVDSITTFHTTIRKPDGSMVFIPNALVMASKIINYHDTPARRIEMKLSIKTESNIKESIALFLDVMNKEQRVLEIPSKPEIFIMSANASGVEMMAYCWVKNEDWFSTRSDIWLNLMDAFETNSYVAMSRPQQDIYFYNESLPCST